MAAFATLTLGWPTPTADGLSAAQFIHNSPSTADRPTVIHACDALFRGCARGFDQLKSFLITIGQLADDAQPIECQFDLFAYAFLSRAKNIDLLIPVRSEEPFAASSYQKVFRGLRDEIRQLEAFERHGRAPQDEPLRDSYLKLREAVTRASARDERRVLSTMFVAGPICAANLAQDLGLSENLATRILLAMARCQCVTADASGMYRIQTTALAPAYFLARETLGLSLLDTANDYD